MPSKQKDAKMNKGVTHKIKKPNFKKIKEKKKNAAKSYIHVTKEVKTPLRLPSNRSPLKLNKKGMKRVLSSPGVSLLESPEIDPATEQKRKFFTSRSKAAATIALRKGINLSSKDGEVSIVQRRKNEKKNVGFQVEDELQKEIKLACTLSSETVTDRLDNIVKKSINTSSIAGPTRLTTASPQKVKRFTPKKKEILVPQRRSPRKTIFIKNSPMKNVAQSPLVKKSDVTFSPRVKSIVSDSLHPSPQKNKAKMVLDSPEKSYSDIVYSPKSTPKRFSDSAKALSPSTKVALNSSPRRSPRRNLTLLSKTEGSPKTPVRCEEVSQSPRRVREMNNNSSSSTLLKTPITAISKTISRVSLQERSPRRSPRRLIQVSKENEFASPRQQGVDSVVGSPQNLGASSYDSEDDLAFPLMSYSSVGNEILSSLIMDGDDDTPVYRNQPRKPLADRNTGNANSTNSKAGCEKVKYFSIFNPQKRSSGKSSNKKPSESNQSEKSRKQFIDSQSDPTQLVLDAGQKEFGAKQCKSCGMLFDIGDPEDELMHQSFHNGLLATLKYTGYKNERQVTNMDKHGGRVIKIVPSDPVRYWNKVKDVLQYIDQELGFVKSDTLRKNKTTVFLYIIEQKIAGCLLVEEITQAFEVIQQIGSLTDANKTGKLICCSAQPQRAFAGISRMWVLGSERRKGIASLLVDAMRANFFPYYYLKIEDFAFSFPTESGIKFAEKYCKKSDFLVYGHLDHLKEN